MANKLILCATPSGQPLAEKVCRELNTIVSREMGLLKGSKQGTVDEDSFRRLSVMTDIYYREFGDSSIRVWPSKLTSFANTEVKPVFSKSLRGADVFLIHHSYEPQTSPEEVLMRIETAKTPDEKVALLRTFKAERRVPENDMLAQMYIDALKRDCKAHSVFLISPYFGNSRQDHRRGREGLTSRTQMRAFEKGGVDGMLFFDLHSQTLVGVSEAPMDNIHPTAYLVNEFKRLFPNYTDEFVLVAPDAGAAKRTEYVADHYISLPLVIGIKKRDYTTENKVENVEVSDPHLVEGKYALIIDDIVDTAGTVQKLVDKLCTQYGCKGAVIIASHSILSGDGIARIDEMHRNGSLLMFITTDSVPRSEQFAAERPWYKEVSISPVIAKAIYNIWMNNSVSDVYLEDGAV